MKKILRFLCLGCFVMFMNVQADENYAQVTVKRTDYNFNAPRSIISKDWQNGWELGTFHIANYTKKEDGQDIYYKQIGDKITVQFDLKQDIKRLDGNKSLKIANIQKGNMSPYFIKGKINGQGTLIIQKTEKNGEKTIPKVYANYLVADSKKANTAVQTLEEGDYDFSLVYAIDNTDLLKDPFNQHQFYRIDYSFKVRNSNAMAFIRDVDTKEELVNGSETRNGFVIDTAQSKYLNIRIKRKDKNGDVRENRNYRDGEKISKVGDYTITISASDDSIATEKTIRIVDPSNSDGSEENVDKASSENKFSEAMPIKETPVKQSSTAKSNKKLLSFGIIFLFIIIAIISIFKFRFFWNKKRR